MRSALMTTPLVAAIFIGVACSDETSPPSVVSDGGADAGVTGTDGGFSPTRDAGPESLTPTKTTSTEASINDVSRTLDRAQFGVTSKDDTLYIEAHEGGVAECPEKETPKRTLIISGVPKGPPGTSSTKADGVTVAFLDFTGDQIEGNPPSTKATAATVTIVAIDGETSVEIEVDATFPEGSAKGRVYATYCAAMSE